MLATNNLPVTVGLYRHFKGEYYYVTGFSKNAHDDSIMVNYFNVCKPEKGNCTRTLTDFIRTHEEDGRVIKDRPDNITGQSVRFERVKDLNFQLGSISTEYIIDELRKRTDSPIHELDINGLNSKVFSKDYVVGEACEETAETPRGVFTIARFDTLEQAQNYMSSHLHNKRTKLFKRTFIEV